jgi:hypothetical protein
LKPVPLTLLDLHSVFVAGFSMIYCAWNDPQLYDVEMAADFGACSTVLYLIAEQWGSGAKKYRDAFELAAEKTAEYVTSIKQSRGGGQQGSCFVTGQQTQPASSVLSNGGNVLREEMQQHSNVYQMERTGHDEWTNDGFDVWQMMNQCFQNQDGSFDSNHVDFAGIEELLVDEGLGWFHGAASNWS